MSDFSMFTDHEQDSILERSCGLDGLLLLAVAVLPHHTLLNHHTGFWELIFTVEEEVIRVQVLQRCSRKQNIKVFWKITNYRGSSPNELHLPPLTEDVRSPFKLLDQQVSRSFGDLQDLQVS